MADDLQIKLYAFTLDCRNPYELAKFYAALLGWEIAFHDEEFACVGAPGKAQGAYPGILFQKNAQHKAPVWPKPSGHSNNRRIWILPSMTLNKQSAMPSPAEQSLRRSSFPIAGASCSILPAIHSVFAR